MRLFRTIGALALLSLCVGRAALAADSITVAAAADLSFAMRELSSGFQARTGNEVRVVYGSSGNFFAQIRSGAPFDVFLSADATYPRDLEKAGLADPGSLSTYAVGKLVLWAPKTSRLDLAALGVKAMLQPGIDQVAIANPRHAPYGRAAVAALEHAGIYKRVKPELVYGENIAQAAHFVESGNADLGLLALSIALAPEMQAKGKYWLIPADWYPPLEQSGVVVRRSRHLETARAFLRYLNSAEAGAILERYGFSLPAGRAAPQAAAAKGRQ